MNTRQQLQNSSSHTPPPTNNDRQTLQPEHLGDVDQGSPAPEEQHDEMGFTPEERAAWDQMEADARAEQTQARQGAPELPPAEGDSDGEDDDDLGADQQRQSAAARQQQPPAPGDDTARGRTISRHKHERELAKRDEELNALRQQLQDGNLNFAKLQERLTILNEALTAPPPVDPKQAEEQARQENPWLEETITVEENAIEALAQMQRRQEYNNRVQQEQRETFAARDEDAGLKDAFTRDIQRYQSQDPTQFPEAPHFNDAYAHLKNSRLTEIAVSLFDKDPNDPNERFTQDEVNRIIQDFNSEEKWVVNNAIQQRKSPAAAIMRLAKGRGWRAPDPAAPGARQNGAQPAPGRQQAPPRQNGAPAPGPGLARPAAPQNGGRAPAAQRLQSEIEGQAASRSLSDGGGTPPAQPLSIEQLLNMDDDEFGAMIDGLPKGRLDALMGKEMPPRGMG